MITTERLILRQWEETDREPFARLNADARVMEFMPKHLSTEESDAVVERIRTHFVIHGFGLFATELKQTGAFIGFIGLWRPSFQARFTPCTEIGWRLAAEYWNQGFATEGARAALEYGFTSLSLDEIVSFTVPNNLRSRRVMEKLGMTRDPDV